MAIVINGEFELARYPFWEMRSPRAGAVQATQLVGSGEPLATRGNGRSSVVAVMNPQRSDYRLKVWRDEDADYDAQDECIVNGQTFILRHRGGGFFTGSVNGLSLRRALRGAPSDDVDEEESYESGPYLDVCVETVFDSDDVDRRGCWRGRVSDFPAWMRARAISITPPQTSGGWHCIMLDAPGVSPYNDRTTVPAMRVNGVWCLAQPVVDEVDEEGMSRWGGRWQLLCDPDELEVARGYGQDGELVELSNESVRPRSRYALRNLHLMVGLSRDEQWAWEEDARTLNRTIVGMASAQGQVDVYAGSRRRYAARAARYDRLSENRYRRALRAKAVGGLSFEEWRADPRDEEMQSWIRSAAGYRKAMGEASSRGAELRARILDLRRAHDDALSRIEEREERYADAIDELYPDFE